MNKSNLIGRLTKTPELKTTASGVNVCSFTLAVNRRFKNTEGNYDADFINCVAWRNHAEFLCKYFGKGDMVGIVGTIQTRNYEKEDGQKVFITEVVVEEVHFCGSKASSGSETSNDESLPEMPITDNIVGFPSMPDANDDIPF